MKQISLAVLVILLFGLIGFTQTEQINKNEWKTLDENEYSIDYPNDWELQKSKMGAVFILTAKETSNNDQFKGNINLIIQELNGKTFEEYIDLSDKEIKRVKSRTLIDSEDLSSSNFSGHKTIFTSEDEKGVMKVLQYLWHKDKLVYLLTFTSTEKEFDNVVAKEIMKSFQLK